MSVGERLARAPKTSHTDPLDLTFQETVVSGNWYSRPVLSVADTALALEFYALKLGFKEDWRFEEESRLRVVQVSRQGCEVILSDQWPEEAGRARIFISLEAPEFSSLRSELIEVSVEAKADWWGYDVLTVEDLDGNRLWFPQPGA